MKLVKLGETIVGYLNLFVRGSCDCLSSESYNREILKASRTVSMKLVFKFKQAILDGCFIF